MKYEDFETWFHREYPGSGVDTYWIYYVFEGWKEELDKDLPVVPVSVVTSDPLYKIGYSHGAADTAAEMIRKANELKKEAAEK